MEYNAIPWKTQTMIAANSCMTLFLSFSLSLSLVHQLKIERAKPQQKYLQDERKRMRKLPNEVNEGATSPNKCSELQSSCV